MQSEEAPTTVIDQGHEEEKREKKREGKERRKKKKEKRKRKKKRDKCWHVSPFEWGLFQFFKIQTLTPIFLKFHNGLV